MCENPEPRASFRSNTIAPTETAWESVGEPQPVNIDPEHISDDDLRNLARAFGKPEDDAEEESPLFEVFAIGDAELDEQNIVHVRVLRCEWFARCVNLATHTVEHPAFPSGVPACDAHGV